MLNSRDDVQGVPVEVGIRLILACSTIRSLGNGPACCGSDPRLPAATHIHMEES